MCFSENQSYLNVALLFFSGIYTIPNYRLSLVGVFFSLKELIQALMYRYKDNKKSMKILGILSWIHICFQPLFVNIFYSHFSLNFKYWNIIFILSFIFGIIMVTELNDLDIQNDPNCKSKSKNDDFCKETGGYIGKYHIGYTFHLDKEWKIIDYWKIWMLLFFIPVFFTRARVLGLLSLLLIVLIDIIYSYLLGIDIMIFSNDRIGEKAAIWCFLTIIFVPFILFEKRIKKMIKN